jgi:Methyltransferase domain
VEGASAIGMAAIVKKLGLDTRIICVDTWLGSDELFFNPQYSPSLRRRHGYPQTFYTFLANVVRSNAQDIIIPLAATSAHGARILTACGIHPDLVYIDAAHDYEAVSQDLRSYWDILCEPGVLIGDDYIGWESVTLAANEFATKKGLHILGQPGKFILCKGGCRARIAFGP